MQSPIASISSRPSRRRALESSTIRSFAPSSPSRARLRAKQERSMSQYQPPLADMHFLMTEIAGLQQIASLPGYEDATPDTVAAILEEAGKFASGVLDPL